MATTKDLIIIRKLSLFCFHVWIVLGENIDKSVEKRLLLTDPDVLGSRLDRLEREQAELKQLVTTLSTTAHNLQTSNTNLQTSAKNIQAHGSTYIRWGKSTCNGGANTEIVYKGYTAGQYYLNKGGPSNTLCLPDNPDIPAHAFKERHIDIWGTEYNANFASHSLNEDAPCALCRNNAASTTIMIPGRSVCYSGWHREYHGILAAGRSAHSPSEFICVDGHPDFLVSGKDNVNGHLLYVVNTKCGPLPCPPYDDNRKVNCVVCTK